MSAQVKPALPQDYQDILQVLPRLPAADSTTAAQALQGLADWPPEQRGQRAWLAKWQGRAQPRLDHPRLALFAANHGVAVWDIPAIKTQDALAALADPAAPLGQAVAALDADLRLYEMNLAQPSGDCTRGAALSRAHCVQAMAYGMMAVDMGLDALALVSCGDGQNAVAAVMLAALLNESLPKIADAIGLQSAFLPQLEPVVARLRVLPPCEIIEQAGSVGIAALFGVLLAARMARTPVIISDWGGLVAMAALDKVAPVATRHVALTGAIAPLPWLAENLRITCGGEGIGLAAVEALRQLRSAAATGCYGHQH